ncbi:unnamed protein product [Adineta ricciae]|uniref:Uncharacterized protein n=1 Tax=Adineta ricciae TaxID=249248 RepID=A0A815X0C3_ADIRI|nr:unnamed protein product [Adineta ricciae]
MNYSIHFDAYRDINQYQSFHHTQKKAIKSKLAVEIDKLTSTLYTMNDNEMQPCLALIKNKSEMMKEFVYLSTLDPDI